MAATWNSLEPSAWNQVRKGLGKVNNKEIMASSGSSSADSAIILTENNIPGASLNGRNPSSLKNEELKFWLRCRGDSLKGLKTKACFVKRWAYATIYTHGFGGTFTLTRRAGERSEAEQSASTNMAFVTVWFLEKPGTELTPVENCLRAVLELVRRRQNSNVLKVHSFPVILILNMPWFLRCSLSKRQ